MKLKNTAVVSTVAASATVNTTESGFLPGMSVVATFNTAAVAALFAGSCLGQTSVDGTTWTTAIDANTMLAMDAVVAFAQRNLIVENFFRVNVTAVTAGAVQVSLISDIG